MNRWYLGTHLANWLGLTDVPLFVSHNRLRGRKTFPRALGPWALDSGAFTVVSSGQEFEPAARYAAAVRRYADEIGNLEWCAPQDWMCEPFVLAKTGYGIEWHQRLTLHSYLDLLDEDVPVIPVLQGWTLSDYLRHADAYAACGIDLTTLKTVGVGSVCRRQSTSEIEAIVTSLWGLGIRVHGFGVKTGGLARYSYALESADSMAWSFTARRQPPLEGCTHKSCANCLRFALAWRASLLSPSEGQQLSLGVAA